MAEFAKILKATHSHGVRDAEGQAAERASDNDEHNAAAAYHHEKSEEFAARAKEASDKNEAGAAHDAAEAHATARDAHEYAAQKHEEGSHSAVEHSKGAQIASHKAHGVTSHLMAFTDVAGHGGGKHGKAKGGKGKGASPAEAVHKTAQGNDGKFVTTEWGRREKPLNVDDYEEAARYHSEQAKAYTVKGDHATAREHALAEQAHKTAAQHFRSGSMGHEVWAEKARKASTGLRNGERKRALQAVQAPDAGLGSFRSDKP